MVNQRSLFLFLSPFIINFRFKTGWTYSKFEISFSPESFNENTRTKTFARDVKSQTLGYWNLIELLYWA